MWADSFSSLMKSVLRVLHVTLATPIWAPAGGHVTRLGHVHHELAHDEDAVGAARGVGDRLADGLAQGRGELVGEPVGHGASSLPPSAGPMVS